MVENEKKSKMRESRSIFVFEIEGKGREELRIKMIRWLEGNILINYRFWFFLYFLWKNKWDNLLRVRLMYGLMLDF